MEKWDVIAKNDPKQKPTVHPMPRPMPRNLDFMTMMFSQDQDAWEEAMEQDELLHRCLDAQRVVQEAGGGSMIGVRMATQQMLDAVGVQGFWDALQIFEGWSVKEIVYGNRIH